MATKRKEKSRQRLSQRELMMILGGVLIFILSACLFSLYLKEPPKASRLAGTKQPRVPKTSTKQTKTQPKQKATKSQPEKERRKKPEKVPPITPDPVSTAQVEEEQNLIEKELLRKQEMEREQAEAANWVWEVEADEPQEEVEVTEEEEIVL
eukprot:c5544_g1_i2.p1 GENE.c5544_g1_i2~~c5544_g1_i2.p1  ORF type:complete len:152 (-),score=24.19 c5544_g1_i2:52-507(-)